MNEHHLPFLLRQYIEHRNPRNLTLHVWMHTLGWLSICVLLSRVPLPVSLPFVPSMLGANAGAWFCALGVLYWLPVDAAVALAVGGITAAFAALPFSTWGPGHGATGALVPASTLAASSLASYLSHVYHHERADFMKGEPRAKAALDAAHVLFFGPFYFYLEKLLALGYRPELRKSLDEKARAAILRRRLTPWRNWAGNVVASPAVVCVPETAEDVVDVVREARGAGRKVRVVASGFSWASFSVTDDYLVFCERLDSIEIDADAEQPSAWVGAGATNRAINAALARRGLTLPYNVVMETVRIGGLVSVGTHGSGRDTATMGDLVLALEVVTPEGEIKILSEETIGAEAMRAVRCSFGTFGVITRVKLRVVQGFRVLQRDSLHDEDALLDELPALMAQHDSVELFWMPYTDKIWLRTLNRTDRPLSFFGHGLWFLTWNFMQMAFMGSALGVLAVRFPGIVVPVMRFGLRTLRFGERVLPVADAQHYRRWLELTRCRCIEVAFKTDAGLTSAVRAWREVRTLVEERRARGEFPLNLAANMRFIGESDALLSPAFGPGLTCYIEALSTEGTPGWREFSAELAGRWMQTRGALPHWAKEFEHIPGIFELARERLGERRTRFLEAHRAVIGPLGGMFSNRLVERLVFEPGNAEPVRAPVEQSREPPDARPGGRAPRERPRACSIARDVSLDSREEGRLAMPISPAPDDVTLGASTPRHEATAFEPADPLSAAFPGAAGAPVRALVTISRVLEGQGMLHGPRRPMRKALAREIVAAREALAAGDLTGATRHAGRMHVLGSFYAISHACSHLVHLRVDLARGDVWGVAVQALRLMGTPFTRPIVPFIGVTGHPGISERAAGTRWPIEPELQALLDAQPRPARPFS